MATTTRTYVCDLPGGTATQTIQMQGAQTLKQAVLTVVNAATGKIEVSKSAASQIGVAQPTADVIARFNVGTSGSTVARMDLSEKVAAFQSIYVHSTGAGNLGTIIFS